MPEPADAQSVPMSIDVGGREWGRWGGERYDIRGGERLGMGRARELVPAGSEQHTFLA